MLSNLTVLMEKDYKTCNIAAARNGTTDCNVIDEYGNVLIKAWVAGVPIEDSVWRQVEHLAAVPGVVHIAVMPDAHVGNGACVGSAILTRDIVIPAAVGVDIGCGMIAAPLNLTVGDIQPYLKEIRHEIEKRVPHGRTSNGGEGDRGAWHDIPQVTKSAFGITDRLVDWLPGTLAYGYHDMVAAYPSLAFPRVVNQFGTLGTGNHFVEVQYEQWPDTQLIDPLMPVWVMLHSGSRGVGNRIGTTFTKLARKEMERWHITLPEPELAYLPIDSELGHAYLKYSAWAQRYAWESRLLMFQQTMNAIASVTEGTTQGYVVPNDDVIHVHHNYIAPEKHFGKPGFVMRKGAINAERDRLGIIPSSMGGISYITRGLGNVQSLNTSSHGAGRTMSRTAIKKQVSLEQFLQEVNGVECRTDVDPPIDETPSAYKQIDAVMNAQRELTEPVTALKALVCVKG